MTVDELIRQYPMVSIEDGYSSPPQLTQSTNELGAWVRASRTPKSDTWFMVNERMNSQLIYPGNVIMVDRNKNFINNMVEIPFMAEERKVLRLDAKYSNEMNDSSSQLSRFTRADVNAFVDRCLTHYKNGSHDLSSNTSWSFERTERKEGITLGGTIKGVDFSGSIGRNKTVTVAYMKQIMYTVSLNNEYSRPSDIFTDRIDVNKFQSNINKTPGGAPAIIDAVRYGRIITIWAIQEGNEAATLNVDKFKLSVSNTKDSTRYYLRIYGGVAGDQQYNIYNTNKKEEIQKALDALKESSKRAMETALPIEFTAKYLGNLTTNINWYVLPYYKTYIPEIKFRVTENNKGADMKCAVYYLRYEMYGNRLEYRLNKVDKKGLDYTFYCSPKSLCFDIKIDVTGAIDKRDFNAMLPCIPYDSIQPNKDGDWEFQINIYGTTVFDTKHFWLKPTVAGAVLSTSNGFFMEKHKDSPLRRFDGAGASEKTILQAYIDWMSNKVYREECLSFYTYINNLHQLRPYF